MSGFQGGPMDSELPKTLPHPVEDDWSMKKPRFKDQEGIEETLPAMSFQDKLLEDHQAEEEEEMMNREEDLNVDDEDVVVERDGQIPSISFSQGCMHNLWNRGRIRWLLNFSNG